MNIWFFDSGLGGLTVLKDTMKLLPNERYNYFADTKNVPYGTKPNEDVIRFVDQAVEYISKFSVKLLVIACNTATSIAIQDLRANYKFPIIGMEPAVKPAIEYSKNKRILVTATSLTLREEKLENLLIKFDTNNIVDKLPLDKLVRFAEDFKFDSPEIEDYLNEKFININFDDYETIVLGCTHFVFYKDLIKKIINKKHIKIIDGNKGTVRRIHSVLKENNLFENYEKYENINFYNPDGVEKNIKRINVMKEYLGIKS